MKQLFKIFACLIFLVACVVAVFGEPIGATGMLVAAPPVVLDTQQIVFLRSLKEEYQAIDTWLSEAEDLSTFVSEGQTLVFPEGGEDPAVYKNRTTDIDDIEPTEDTHKVALDVYDSQNYKLRNIYMHALPFEKIQFYTKKSSNAIVKQEIADAAYAFSPLKDQRKCIVMGTTGYDGKNKDDGTPIINTRDGFNVLTLTDVVKIAMACDREEFPEDGRNLVLPSDMWWDLVNNNKVLSGQLERVPLNGIIKPLIVEYYGFKIHKSLQNLGIGYDLVAQEKAAQGTIITGDVVPCGFVFVKEMVFHAGGSFEMFFENKQQNPGARADVFGFQHRFKADHQMKDQRYSALIYMSKKA
jgi:hypothetical protein